MFFNRIKPIIVFVCAFVRFQLSERLHAILLGIQPEEQFYKLFTVFHLFWLVVVFDRERKLEVRLVRQVQRLVLLYVFQVGAHLRIVPRGQVRKLECCVDEHHYSDE